MKGVTRKTRVLLRYATSRYTTCLPTFIFVNKTVIILNIIYLKNVGKTFSFFLLKFILTREGHILIIDPREYI